MASLSEHSAPSIWQKLGHTARSQRWQRTAVVVLILVALFGVAGFFVAPPLIKDAAEQQLSQQLSRPATIGRVAFNPYLLRLEADDIHIGGHKEQEAFVDIGQLVVRVSWTSLVRFAPIIREVLIVRPRLSIIRYDAQRFNFTDLMEASSAPSPKSGSHPMHFAVSNIQVEDGQIEFDDRLLNVRHVVDQWWLAIPFIATLPSAADIYVKPSLRALLDGSPVALDAETKPFAQSFDSSVDIKLDGIDVPHLVSYVPASLPIAVNSGKLSSYLTVTFAMSGGQPTLSLSGSLDLNDAQITTPANQPLFAARTVHVAATQLEPLAGVLHFADIRIDEPAVSLDRDEAGVFNVEKLAGGGESTAAPETPAAAATKGNARPLDLVIEQFAINDGALRVTDASLSSPANLSLTHMAATLGAFSLTGQAPASYTLSTDLESGGSIKAAGSFNLAARQAQTKLSIDALALSVAQPYLAEAMSARVMGGALNASVRARVDWSKAPFDAQVSDSELSLKALQVALPDGKAPALSLDNASVAVSKIDLAARNAEIAKVEAAGLAIGAVRLANGQIDLAALAGPRGQTASQGKSVAGPAQAQHLAQPESPAWHYRIDEINLKDAKATFIDRTTPQPVNLEIAPLNVTVRQIGDDLSKPFPVKLTATINNKGTMDLAGEVVVDPLKVDMKLDGNRVDAAAFAPYFGNALNAKIASAFLNAKGDVAFEQAKRGPRASYRGDVALVDVRMLDPVSSDSFAGWRSLALTGLKAGYDDARGVDVDAARVTFSNFYGNVLLDAQGLLHLRNVIAKKDGKDAESPSQRPEAEQAAALPAAGPPAAPPAKRPLHLHFGQLRLQNGRVSYTDNFIRPNYTADLVAIGGTIGAFGTDTTVAAPVDIGARLTANGPITIKGEVSPLAAQPSLNLTAQAKDIELTNLTAYSAKYAGYPITKGKLNVDLHYQLANNQLTANNHIFIDQFTFGDHVENDTATHLPVRLAIALLKNSQGQIDVNIPVSGSLSDPDFSIGSLIWQAFLNLLQKAVTSPFTLLASAFGSDAEDLGYVEFSPGLAELSETSQQKLDTITKMLTDKPSVSLDLIGRVDPNLDLPGLRTAYVQHLVKKQKLGDVTGRGKSIDPATVKVEPSEYSKYLTEAYQAADFQRPRNMIGLLKTLPDADMEKALADHAPVDGSSLNQLAQARAQAVRQYLEGKIDETRVFVVAPKLDASGIEGKGATTRVDFTLK